MIEISLDIETFASEPGASIASIGCADSNGRTFYVSVDDPEGLFSPRTIRWHAQTGSPVSSTGADMSPVDLPEALLELNKYLLRVRADVEGASRIWAHGSFDIPQLAGAYFRAGLRPAWHYRNTRDLRTLYDFAGGRPTLKRAGIHHNARDDAAHQLREVEACLSRIKELQNG